MVIEWVNRKNLYTVYKHAAVIQYFFKNKTTNIMKKYIFNISVQFILLISLTCAAHAQNNLGVGTAAPDPSAKLDVTATDKGILIPRMTTTARNAITAPAKGLMVYDSTVKAFYYHNGTAWGAVGGGPILMLKATATNAQNAPVGSPTITPDVATCFTTTTNVGNAYNASTGVYTVQTDGLYLITIQLLASATSIGIAPMIDMNNDGVTANDFYGTVTSNSTAFPTGYANRGQLTSQIYLTAGQIFSIRLQSTSSVLSVAVATTGSSNLNIVKLL